MTRNGVNSIRDLGENLLFLGVITFLGTEMNSASAVPRVVILKLIIGGTRKGLFMYAKVRRMQEKRG